MRVEDEGASSTTTGGTTMTSKPEHDHGRNDDDLEAVRRSERAEHVDVAGPLVAEMEVRSDDHPARAASIDQHLLDERFGRHARERLVEGQDEHVVCACAAQELRATRRRRQQRRGALGREHARRVRIEEHRERAQTPVTRAVLRFADERAMADVHTVVVARSDDAGKRHGRFVRVFAISTECRGSRAA
jgi:hypothetical protein